MPFIRPVPRGFVVSTVFAFALVARGLLLWSLPVMPAGDGYSRLSHADAAVVYGWLPLYQVCLDLAVIVSRNVNVLRAENVVFGALACAGFAGLLRLELGPRLALLGGVVLALSPVHAITGAGLYQEPLFTALCCAGIVAVEGRSRAAVPLLVLASMTRYEGWLLAGIVAIAFLRRREWGAAAALAVAPLLWLAARVLLPGATPLDAGLELSIAPERFAEQAGILWRHTPYWVGWPLAGLSGVGLITCLVSPPGSAARILLLFGAMNLVFLAVAHPFSPPDNMRQLHVTVLVAIFLALRAVTLLPERTRAAAALLAAPLMTLPVARGLVDARSWPGPLVESAARSGAALRGQVGHERILVLDPGSSRHPGEEPAACLAVMAYAEAPRRQVLCDNEVPDEHATNSGLLRWLRAEGVEWIVEPGVAGGGLPIHRVVAELAATAALEGCTPQPPPTDPVRCYRLR